MEDFEISIKSSPGGSHVTVKGTRKVLLVEFAVLAAAISNHTGLPLDMLARAVSLGDEAYQGMVQRSVTIDSWPQSGQYAAMIKL